MRLCIYQSSELNEEKEFPIMSAYIVMKRSKCSGRKKIYIYKIKLKILE